MRVWRVLQESRPPLRRKGKTKKLRLGGGRATQHAYLLLSLLAFLVQKYNTGKRLGRRASGHSVQVVDLVKSEVDSQVHKVPVSVTDWEFFFPPLSKNKFLFWLL
jgi:hypothetical protein